MKHIHLLMGAPGVGKTFRAEEYARTSGARFVRHMLHQWSDADELFYGVNVVAAVAGDADSVRRPGVLDVAARASMEGPVVLLLDEVDKATEATEALLLDFLQGGRVPIGPACHIQADMDNMVVFITANDSRPLGDALLRRCRREFMRPLPVDKQEAILQAETGASKGLVRVAWKVARMVASHEGNEALSLQEGFGLLREIMGLDRPTPAGIIAALQGYAARTSAGAEYAATLRSQVATIISELK